MLSPAPAARPAPGATPIAVQETTGFEVPAWHSTSGTGKWQLLPLALYIHTPWCDFNACASRQVLPEKQHEAGEFIEVQDTAEGHAFRRNEFDAMLDLAHKGTQEIIRLQRSVPGC